MTRGDYNDYKGWKIPENENPEDKGYLVKYSDGYESWSPKDVFEAAYKECNGMTFGIAVELLKKGFKVAREGWNGKEMFLYLTTDSEIPVVSMKPETAKHLFGDRLLESDMTVKINGHVDMKTADGSVCVGWSASQTDILAEDWVIVE